MPSDEATRPDLERVAAGLAECDEAVVGVHVGEVEARHPLDRGQGGVERLVQRSRNAATRPGWARGRSRRP